MSFNTHSELVGRHAFLSASNYHWLNYTADKLRTRYTTWQAAQRGTDLHLLAHDLIRLAVKLPNTKKTLNMYVNDAIGFRMKTEQVLYYSDNCFGTADAIILRKGVLRIHDLKNGVSPVSMKQLMIYTALYCLEYRCNPEDFEIELRIYQNDDVDVYTPDDSEIYHIMDKIREFDQIIEMERAEGIRD